MLCYTNFTNCTNFKKKNTIPSQYYVFSVCVSLRSTVRGELALCHLTVYSSYSIWTADTQAIQEVPLNSTQQQLTSDITQKA